MCAEIVLVHPLQDWLSDRTEIRRCPLNMTRNKPLYCSYAGVFYSHVRIKDPLTGTMIYVYREVKPVYTPNVPSRKWGGAHNYMWMRNFGSKTCHSLVATAWLGPRPVDDNGVPFDCDHLNCCPLDNRVSNLEWISKSDHYKRTKRQNALREKFGNLSFFTAEELHRFFDMPQEDFNDLMAQFVKLDPTFDKNEYDMTHHMEI